MCIRDSDSDELRQRIAAGDVDWVTVTSSAIARSLANSLGQDLAKMAIASISPITSGALRDCGFEPDVEATYATMQGLTAAILGNSE